MNEMMTIPEAATFFRVGESTIRTWIREEELPTTRTSKRGKHIISRSEALQWWRRRREEMAALSAGISNETRNQVLQFLRKAS